MTYYFIDDFDNICRQKDGMDKDFAEVIDLIELINDINKIQEENEQLKFEKNRYKRLSEIRQENINNRILTIKKFIDNCSDKKVKKTLEELFHSEVNEYDLSKKIRKLEKENEQLKQELGLLAEFNQKPIL